jgi:ubiquinone/menaquinone biosynthesis C-methylase UbiE
MFTGMTNKRSVVDYYSSLGTRYGYKYILGGTKHFGLYREGDSRWNFTESMRRMEDRLAAEVDLPEGSKLLDAGCGVGDVARHLARYYGYEVVGIDILDFNIAEARERARSSHLSSRTHFELMSYDDLAYDNKSFDGVYTMETLVHAQDAELVLGNFSSVLKPGGRLVLFEYAHSAQLSVRERISLSRVNGLASMPSFQRFELGVLDDLVSRAGFVDICRTDITQQMEPMFRSFAQMARLPYLVSRIVGKPNLFVNAMSAAEMWKMRGVLHYCIYTATKPSS